MNNSSITQAKSKIQPHEITGDNTPSADNFNLSDTIFANDDYLISRGIARAAALMGWQPGRYYDGRPGYEIPVTDDNGSRVRFRARNPFDSGGKTRWMGEQGSYTPKWYYPPNIQDHITAADGKLIIASGEMDVLTFVEIGRCNVTAFSSEGAIPANFIEQLQQWGVTHVDHWPDNDDAGLKSARRLHDLLTDAGITFNAYELAGMVDEKGDTNDLWQAVNFDAERFLDALNAAPLADLPTIERKPQKTFTERDYSGDEWPPEFVQAVIRALEGQPKARRRRDQILCCSPFRDERTPSFSFSIDKLTGYDFGTHTGYGIIETAAALGIDISDYRRRPSTTGSRGNLDAAPGDDTAARFERRWQARLRTLDSLYPTPDETINRAYVGHFPDGDIAIDSPVGTGKTTAAAAPMKAAETAVAYNDSVTLVGGLSRALDLDTYESFSGQQAGAITHAKRLAITTYSAHRRAESTPPEALYIDEPDYCLRSLSTDIMRNKDRNAATLRRDIAQSGRVMVGQANISPVGWSVLKEIRPTIRLIKNEHRPDRGTVEFTSSAGAAVLEAVMTAANGGLTAITSDSRSLLQAVTKHAENADYTVIVIHGWNSQEAQTIEAIKQINAIVSRHKKEGRGLLLLISPSAAVGFNVDGKVSAEDEPIPFDYVATVGANQVTPETYVQMNMRIRHAKRRRVYIPGADSDDLPTDAEAILNDLRAKVSTTAKLADFAGHNLPVASDGQGWITGIDARYQAWDNLQNTDRVGFTAAFFHRAGFTPTYADIEDTTDADKWLADVREAFTAYRDERTKTEQPVTTVEFDELRSKGHLLEAHFYGRRRDQIQRAAGGRDINLDGIYERFDTRTKRRRLYHAERLNKPRIDLQQLDRADVALLPKFRNHFTEDYDFHMGAWSAVFNSTMTRTSDIYSACEGHIFTEDDTARLLNYVLTEHDFQTVCKRLTYRTEKDPRTGTEADRRRVAAGLLRALARSINILITNDQRNQTTIDGKRVSCWTYKADGEQLQLAIEDLAWREAFTAGEAAHFLQNRSIDFAVSVQKPPTLTKGGEKPPTIHPDGPPLPAWMGEIEF